MQASHKKAFTMIELIFVIVIIGILSAVALPKLTATRDDAEVATVLSNVKNFITDLDKYYTGNGRTNYISAKTPVVTSVPLYLNPTCMTRADMNQRNFVGSTAYICQGNRAVVLITTSNSSSVIQTVNIKHLSSATTLSRLLGSNDIFQSFTNGTTGRTYIIGGSKVTP